MKLMCPALSAIRSPQFAMERHTTRVLPVIVLFLAVLSGSCHRRTSGPATPSPPSPTRAALARYEAGEESFDAGNYQAAARSYEAYLEANIPENQDRAHFRIGLAYALSGDTAPNLNQVRLHLQRLVTGFPNSPYRVPAELILSLEAEIEKLRGNLQEQQAKTKALNDELQRLKAIDLQRRPSRPPQ